MKTSIKQYFKDRFKSIIHAYHGMTTLIKEERNAQFHVLAAIVVVVLGFLTNISRFEWIILMLVVGLVFAFEAINTSIENLADFASNKAIHSTIKKVKDISAAAVLFISIMALIIGLIIFIPKLI